MREMFEAALDVWSPGVELLQSERSLRHSIAAQTFERVHFAHCSRPSRKNIICPCWKSSSFRL